ncbi:hypothetical protein DBR47_08860 [Paucibacter sp. KBW04]|nr:hypothetical protein DBR47_08860 [Paucibacter sp. KBW04]
MATVRQHGVCEDTRALQLVIGGLTKDTRILSRKTFLPWPWPWFQSDSGWSQLGRVRFVMVF